MLKRKTLQLTNERRKELKFFYEAKDLRRAVTEVRRDEAERRELVRKDLCFSMEWRWRLHGSEGGSGLGDLRRANLCCISEVHGPAWKKSAEATTARGQRSRADLWLRAWEGIGDNDCSRLMAAVGTFSEPTVQGLGRFAGSKTIGQSGINYHRWRRKVEISCSLRAPFGRQTETVHTMIPRTKQQSKLA